MKTLLEAIVLVFLVMYLFLQNFRATLIPTIAVPVVLLGTFGVLAALGFSINMLTMFAMVLAIGLLVDDAIVVVENVERLMSEEGLSPLEATRKSMEPDHRRAGRHRPGAVGGVRADGLHGRLDRRHLPPVLGHHRVGDGAVGAGRDRADAGAVRDHAEAGRQGPPDQPTRASSAGSTAPSIAAAGSTSGGVHGIVTRGKRFMAIFAALVAVMVLLFLRLPSSFLPAEDQGILFSMVQAPVGATQERTMETIEKVEQHFLQNEKETVESIFSVQGFSFGGTGQNTGIAFVKLKDWSERTAPEARPRCGRRPRHGRADARSRMRWPSPLRRRPCRNSAPPPASCST